MLAVNQENEKLMEEYEKLASEVSLRPETASPDPQPVPSQPGPTAPPNHDNPRPGPAEPPSPQSSLGLPQPPPAIFTHLMPASANQAPAHSHHSFTHSFIHSWWGEHDLSSPSPPPASPGGGLVSPSGVLTERATDAPCEHEDGRPQAPREAGPADTWISDFRPPGLGDDNLLSFNPLV